MPGWAARASVLPNAHLQAHSQVNDNSRQLMFLVQYFIPIIQFHSLDKNLLSTDTILDINNDQNTQNFLLSWK